MSAKSSLKDPDLRRLRALGMIDMRIRGKTNKEVAKAFNVSEDTVERTLTWAKKAELVVQAEDKILRELVPAAQTAILAVLQGDDLEVKAKTALEIFKGTLPSFAKGKPNAGPTVSDAGSLSSYIDSLRNELSIDGTVVGGDSVALPEDLARSPQRLIEATAASTVEERVSAPAASAESAADESGNPRSGE